jgi:PAS domain S-box-containing protein
MKDSNDYYRVLFEHVGVGVAVVQEDGVISAVNTVFEEASGYSRAEIEGRGHYGDLFVDCDQDPVAEMYASDQGASPEPVRYEARLRRKDGEEIPIYLSVALVPENRHVILAVMDITEWVSMRQQLLHAEKLSLVGQLVSNVAHELNNPLTSILGFSQLSQGKGSDQATNADLRLLWLQSERAKRIVANLQSVVRRREPEPSYVDVNEIVECALELLDYELLVDDIKVQRELEPDLPWTMADPDQIQQVIMNLAHNAHQAMMESDGRGTLTLRTYLVPKEIDPEGPQEQFLRIEVQDTGPGFAPAVLPHLFEPFFTTKAEGEGTGLGLAICRGLVESHDGRIGVVARPGGEDGEDSSGATVFVELPIKERPEGFSQAPEPRVERRRPTGLRILVVEDEEANRLLLARILEEDGHQVATARDGQEALDRLGTEEFQVVVLDLKMPRMSGRELFWHMERDWPELAQHTLLVTGDIVNPATKHFLSRVRNPVVTKPFNVEDILRVLAEVAPPAVEDGNRPSEG